MAVSEPNLYSVVPFNHGSLTRNLAIFDTLMVAITAVGPSQYLLSSYLNIWLYDAGEDSISLMTPELTGGPYHPTGLFFSHAHQQLFVANYIANNILVFQVDLPGRKLVQTQTIATPNLISPENVFVTEDGRYLASANYDGNNVTLVDLSSGQPQERWCRAMPNAHGVAILKGKVYATSLGEKKLYELSLESGESLRTLGQPGWNAMTGDFMWPTTVALYDAQHILVSDAHTGFVSLINLETFLPVRVLGGQGASFPHFNMPYSVYRHEDSVFVLSTFQQAILRFDADHWNLVKISGPDSRQWQYPAPSREPEIRNEHYVSVGRTPFTLFSGQWQCSYDGIYHPESGLKIYMSRLGTLFSPSFYYFIQKITNPQKNSLLLISPQSTGGMYFRDLYVLPFISPVFDFWEIENHLYGPFHGGFHLSEIETRYGYDEAIAELENNRCANGWLDATQYLDVCKRLFARRFQWSDYTRSPVCIHPQLPGLFGYVTGPQAFESERCLLNSFKASFQSIPGATFLQQYFTFNEETPRAVILQAAEGYYQTIRAGKALHEEAIYLDEYALVGMLCNVQPPFPREVELSTALQPSENICENPHPKDKWWTRVFRELRRLKRRVLS